MVKDNRESNIIRNDKGNITGYKQSEYTCRFILIDKENHEYVWVVENQSLSEAIEKIGLNEEEKYGSHEKNPRLLGRNMFFLSWLYEFYEHYLTKFGFNPPKEHLEKAKKFKHGKFKNR